MAATALSLRYSLPKVLFHTRTVMIPWFDPGKQLPLTSMQVPAHLYHLCYLPASSTLPESQDASSLLNHCCPPLKSQDGISKQAKVKMTGTSAAILGYEVTDTRSQHWEWCRKMEVWIQNDCGFCLSPKFFDLRGKSIILFKLLLFWTFCYIQMILLLI